jgi:glycosyltransferase involved in cell wall biosynthesis
MATSLRIRNELSKLMPQASFAKNKSIAVLIPCYNEEATIGDVVEQFRRALPAADIYVYDNNSTDDTAVVAANAGAIVRRELNRGKGNVLRRMFADVDADIYVLADGDRTYDAGAAGIMIDALVADNVDMVVGVRVGEKDAFRRGHQFGNRLFNSVVSSLFGPGFTDILSGYRALSRRFVKSFPASSSGFEIETELSVHALDLRLPAVEIPLRYGERPENSKSKLNTYRDGLRILLQIAMMYRMLKPLQFYSGISIALFAAALLFGMPVVVDYFETGLVQRFPTAILAASIVQLGFMSFVCGIIIDAVSASRRELKRMRYLDLPSPSTRER